MRQEIDEMLAAAPRFTDEVELRSFISKVKQKISEYEHKAIEDSRRYADAESLMKGWRKKILEIILESKKGLKRPESQDGDDEMLETVMIASRQINKANINLHLLDKSTLKLVGLNYSCRDIENEISKAKDVITKNKLEEKKEIWMVYLGILVLLVVCVAILLDKFLFV